MMNHEDFVMDKPRQRSEMKRWTTKKKEEIIWMDEPKEEENRHNNQTKNPTNFLFIGHNG